MVVATSGFGEDVVCLLPFRRSQVLRSLRLLLLAQYTHEPIVQLDRPNGVAALAGRRHELAAEGGEEVDDADNRRSRSTFCRRS